MKKFLIIALLLAAKSSFAQKDTTGLNIPVRDGKVIYELMIDAPGKSKESLYTNVRLWFVDYFKTSRNDFQKEDRENGQVIASATVIVPFKGALGTMVPYEDKFAMLMECKDHQCKITVYNQVLTSPPTDYGKLITTPEILVGKLTGTAKSPFNQKQARRMLESANNTIMTMLDNCKKALVSNKIPGS